MQAVSGNKWRLPQQQNVQLLLSIFLIFSQVLRLLYFYLLCLNDVFIPRKHNWLLLWKISGRLLSNYLSVKMAIFYAASLCSLSAADIMVNVHVTSLVTRTFYIVFKIFWTIFADCIVCTLVMPAECNHLKCVAFPHKCKPTVISIENLMGFVNKICSFAAQIIRSASLKNTSLSQLWFQIYHLLRFLCK